MIVFESIRSTLKKFVIVQGLDLTFSGRNDLKSLGDLLCQEQSHNLLVSNEEEDLGTIWCPDAHL